jgi:hypothetical protein
VRLIASSVEEENNGRVSHVSTSVIEIIEEEGTKRRKGKEKEEIRVWLT